MARMIYDATVEEIDEGVDEAVTLLVEGLRILCFSSVCPYPIKKGEKYSVSLTLAILNDYIVAEVGSGESSIKRIGQGFSHMVAGKLTGDVLDAGIAFQDEVFLSDYGYLDGKVISVKVDRIDAEFL